MSEDSAVVRGKEYEARQGAWILLSLAVPNFLVSKPNSDAEGNYFCHYLGPSSWDSL